MGLSKLSKIKDSEEIDEIKSLLIEAVNSLYDKLKKVDVGSYEHGQNVYMEASRLYPYSDYYDTIYGTGDDETIRIETTIKSVLKKYLNGSKCLNDIGYDKDVDNTFSEWILLTLFDSATYPLVDYDIVNGYEARTHKTSLEDFRDFLVQEIKDSYESEQHLYKALERFVENASPSCIKMLGHDIVDYYTFSKWWDRNPYIQKMNEEIESSIDTTGIAEDVDLDINDVDW